MHARDEGHRHEQCSTLKKILQVEVSGRTASHGNPSAIILDGCAIFWTVPYPRKGSSVDDFIRALIAKIKNDYLSVGDVYLPFDSYKPDSIKAVVFAETAGKHASREHTLTLDSPLPPQQILYS